ncbi:LOW QUALITY PROTEIN: actinodin2 [Anoplopoma fimbria]|uniref:LOW QUALITY PROTEIN: actinodin2 n=1 Tax=Anoplopoma fimbria TaxID=229290 RepID=UPI0023ECEEF8|nr:LOW QUALITY PROTEIN: actinodin2 [Anoplopoma fimbria]
MAAQEPIPERLPVKGFKQLRQPQFSKTPPEEARSREPLDPEVITGGQNFSTFAEFLGAVPVEQHRREEVPAVSDDDNADAMENLRTLVRNRRNSPYLALPQFKRLPDFWGWYKYFMQSQNQEGVEDLDRLYMAYLQNKHRSEEGPTYNHYLKHLSEVYKSCADSDDPECISESTSKPKAALVMPAPIKSAAVRMCNPYLDPYCLFPLAPAAAPAPEAAPAKVPAPILTPMLPMPLKSPTGFYYYAPVLEPFLSAEQRSELLRICSPEDVECLQYHLRAAYGYRPATGPAPSYAALKCDPKDPYCMPTLVHKAPTGYYHRLYPSCDPAVDPLCVTNVAAPLTAEEAPKEQHCNPLFDGDCNPLTATKLSGLTKPVLEYGPHDEPSLPAARPACDPRYDPYCILAAAAALRKPAPQIPEHQVRYKLGVRGKTREGYDCYVHYDKDCTPVRSGSEAKSDIKAPAEPSCHPFDPNCVKFAGPSGVQAPKPHKDGLILPDPDCDPEYDYNCRLRRAEPAAVADEPAAADEPAKEAAVPLFDDFLRGVMSQHK